RRILAVQKARIEERRAGEVLRRTVAQSERGDQPSLRAGKRRVGVEAVICNPASPSWNETRVNEDAVAEPDHCLLSERIGDAQSRGEGFEVPLFGVPTAKACRPGLVAGESQAARPIASRRIQSDRIKEGEEVVFLDRRRDGLPTKAVVKAELRIHAPGIADMSDPGRLHGD